MFLSGASYMPPGLRNKKDRGADRICVRSPELVSCFVISLATSMVRYVWFSVSIFRWQGGECQFFDLCPPVGPSCNFMLYGGPLWRGGGGVLPVSALLPGRGRGGRLARAIPLGIYAAGITDG